MSLFEEQSLPIFCAGESILLHPQRALYWPARRTLLVADVHVGKEHTFGRTGIAIPGGISENTLRTLFALYDASGARQLIVLGDFMHAAPVASEGWLTTLSQQLTQRPDMIMRIVAGNHDKSHGQRLIDSRVLWHADPLEADPFVLQHEPTDDPRGYVLSGHLHPAWRLSHARRSGVRAPVFWFRQHYAVLPSFGMFTGGASITADSAGDKLYMALDDGVIEVPASAMHNRRNRR